MTRGRTAALAGLLLAGYASATVGAQGIRSGGQQEAPFHEADAIVAAGVGRAYPGAVLAVGHGGRLAHLRAFGHLSYEPGAKEAGADTIYDLASLTKVVVTTTVAMMLVDEGRLDLDARVGDFFPSFRGGAKGQVTVRQLLTHTGGFLWWAPLYKELSGKQAYLERIAAMELDYAPGTRAVYSDLGIILLGDILERCGGAPLEELARSRVLGPLEMRDTSYRPEAALLARIAPTENDPWRGRLLRGEVDDANAFALGGVAPHAGLFGTAEDLSHLAQMLLDGGVYDGRRLVSRATVELFTRRAGIPGVTRALGWDTPSDGSGRRSSVPGEAGYSSAGSLLSTRSFGHTGFTGTSMWMDPERDLYVILLTNRVHPSHEQQGIAAVRARVADAVVLSLSR